MKVAANVFHPLSAALSVCVKASGFRHAIQCRARTSLLA